jgi:hypothetical protein
MGCAADSYTEKIVLRNLSGDFAAVSMQLFPMTTAEKEGGSPVNTSCDNFEAA